MTIDHYDFNVSVICAISEVANENMFRDMTNEDLIQEIKDMLNVDESWCLFSLSNGFKIEVLKKVLENRGLSVTINPDKTLESRSIEGGDDVMDYYKEVDTLCTEGAYRQLLEDLEPV